MLASRSRPVFRVSLLPAIEAFNASVLESVACSSEATVVAKMLLLIWAVVMREVCIGLRLLSASKVKDFGIDIWYKKRLFTSKFGLSSVLFEHEGGL